MRDWRGSALPIAVSAWKSFRHVEAMGRHMGLEFQEMSNSDMKEIYPLETYDFYGGQWDEFDGDIDSGVIDAGTCQRGADRGQR